MDDSSRMPPAWLLSSAITVLILFILFAGEPGVPSVYQAMKVSYRATYLVTASSVGYAIGMGLLPFIAVLAYGFTFNKHGRKMTWREMFSWTAVLTAFIIVPMVLFWG